MIENVLFIIALTVLLGTAGANVFKRLRIPQVVAYILVGLVIGQTGFGLIPAETIDHLAPIYYVALGIIGFLIGGELRTDALRKDSKQLFAILLTQGLTPFLLVTLFIGFFTHNWQLAIIIGAIASATAPAATVNVLWEYKSLGVVTSAIFAIVALDDGLALLLYGFATSIAPIIGGSDSITWYAAVGHAVYEIFVGIGIGVVCGLALTRVLKRHLESELLLGLGLGSVLFVIGLSQMLGVDLILAAMALGVTVTNIRPDRSKELFEALKGFATPIYVMFFVLTGARLNIAALDAWIWAAAGGYVIARSVGKFVGVYAAARATKAHPNVRKYLGMALHSQGGVAIGLSILAFETFGADIGTAIVAIVMTTTLLVEVVGPLGVRYAITKADEVGRNVTEEDLIRSYRVRDVMGHEPIVIPGSFTSSQIVDAISDSDRHYHPVVDQKGDLIGILGVQNLMTALSIHETQSLIIAYDMMQPATCTVGPDEWLADTLEHMRRDGHEYMAVVDGAGGNKVVGTLELDDIRRAIREEFKKRHRSSE